MVVSGEGREGWDYVLMRNSYSFVSDYFNNHLWASFQ